MKSLYESIMDVDDNIENIDSSLLIGGHYYIDIKDIRCTCLRDIFKIYPLFHLIFSDVPKSIFCVIHIFNSKNNEQKEKELKHNKSEL